VLLVGAEWAAPPPGSRQSVVLQVRATPAAPSAGLSGVFSPFPTRPSAHADVVLKLQRCMRALLLISLALVARLYECFNILHQVF
jgi:hypothetical protein